MPRADDANGLFSPAAGDGLENARGKIRTAQFMQLF
jgi:hypothetical protein